MKRSVVSLLILISIAMVMGCQTSEQKKAEYDKNFTAGWQLMKKGDFAGSIPYYQKAIRILPDDPKTAVVYNNLGWSLQKTGDLQGAISAYEKALQLNPNYSLARNNLKATRQQAAAGQPSP